MQGGSWWLLAGAGLLAYGLLSRHRERLLGFREVGPVEAVRLMNDEDALVLDVRTVREFAAGHVAGARHLPLAELPRRLEELAPWRERPVLIFCHSGRRSARAAALLRRAGFQRVHKLRGGLLAWEEARLPLRRGTVRGGTAGRGKEEA